MKNSWRHYLRRLATATVVSGSVAWSSAMCYAVNSHPITRMTSLTLMAGRRATTGGPASGRGVLMGPVSIWSITLPQSHEIDDGMKSGTQHSSTFNDLMGKAWTIYNFNGRNPPGTPSVAPSGQTDIARAGRALSTPLQVGQTISVVIDNPIEQAFFRGYNVKLNSGGGNICYGGATCTPGTSPVLAWGVGTFDHFTYGQWGGPTPSPPLFDYHTDGGVRIDFTLTDSTNYSFTMTPLDGSAAPYTGTGTLENTDPIDWIEFQFYNTDSDFYPTMVAMDARATDYYIRSIEITMPRRPASWATTMRIM